MEAESPFCSTFCSSSSNDLSGEVEWLASVLQVVLKAMGLNVITQGRCVGREQCGGKLAGEGGGGERKHTRGRGGVFPDGVIEQAIREVERVEVRGMEGVKQENVQLYQRW